MATDDTVPDEPIVDHTEPIDEIDVGTEQKALLLTAGLVIVGAFLPWYSILGVSVIGIEGDGLLSLIIAIGVLGVAWYLGRSKRAMVAGVAGGVLIVLLAFYHVTSVSDMGVYITLFGGLGMLVAGLSGYWKLR